MDALSFLNSTETQSSFSFTIVLKEKKNVFIETVGKVNFVLYESTLRIVP